MLTGRSWARRVGVAALVVTLGGMVSGCIVVAPRHGGWCYYHPYRCR